MARTSTKCLLLLVALLPHLGSISGGALPQAPAPERPLIALRISVPKNTYKAGEILRLKVEIENVGHEPVFIGSEIMNIADWIQSLQFVVTDSRGKPCPIRTALPPFVMPPKETFTEALVKNWVPLRPGYSYGRTLVLDEPFLKTPGRYKIRALYKSMDMYAPLYYNTLSAHPGEIKKLPFPAWEGIAESNTLSVQITE